VKEVRTRTGKIPSFSCTN